MKITKLQLRNWKNFTQVDLNLTRRSFIVGPNASGKSNLLDSLRFLHDICKQGGGLSKALNDRGGFKKLRSLSARSNPFVDIEVELVETTKEGNITWNYLLSLKQESRGNHRTLINKEVVKRDNKTILDRPDEADKSDDLRLTQTSLEQINVNSDFREIFTFFQEIGYIHLIPQIIRQPELFFNTPVKLDDDSYGFHFMEKIVKTKQNVLTSRLKKIEAALRLAVPQLTNLNIAKDENGVPHLEAIYEHWRPNAGKQRESQFSDGTIRMIGFLWSIMDNKSLILLEEPELSLHPGIVRKLPVLINNLTKNRKNSQIILSTHSPDLLSDRSISAKEIIILNAQKEGTIVKTADEIAEIKVLLESGMSPDEVVIPYVEPRTLDQLELFS